MTKYRYTCPHCFRSFVTQEFCDDWFCWQCGEGLEVVDAKQNDWPENKEEAIVK